MTAIKGKSFRLYVGGELFGSWDPLGGFKAALPDYNHRDAADVVVAAWAKENCMGCGKPLEEGHECEG